jgi:Domain of unknown function (DU1801)
MSTIVNKTQPTINSVLDFLNAYTKPDFMDDCLLLLDFFKRITGCEAVLWGKIIGFGLYHYKYQSGREGDYLITGFAPSKVGITIYNIAGYDGVAGLMDKLGKYKIGKSCLYIKKLSDIDLGILEQVVKYNIDYVKETYQTSNIN